MEIIKVHILLCYSALLIAIFFEATLALRVSRCCPNKRSVEGSSDIVIRIPRQMPFSTFDPTFLNQETDPFSSSIRNFGLVLPPAINPEQPGAMKAYSCSLMICRPEDQTGPVCACNFNTGNVVSFKNQCDVLKHNCRFDTGFRVILNEICPWEFQSRRDNKPYEFNYTSSKYYN